MHWNVLVNILWCRSRDFVKNTDSLYKTYSFHKPLTFNAVTQCSFFVIRIICGKFWSWMKSGTFIYCSWTIILWNVSPTRAKICIRKEIDFFYHFRWAIHILVPSQKNLFSESFVSSSFFKHASFCHG